MRPDRLSAFLAPIRIRYLLLIVVVLGLIFFSLTYLGIRKARQSLLNIMADEGKALVEGLALSSNNAIQAGLLLQSLSEQKFADVSESAVSRLGRNAPPTQYRSFRDENDLLSIDLLDTSLAVIGSDRWAQGFTPTYPPEVQAEVHDIRQMGGGYRSVVVNPEDSASPTVQYFVYAVGEEGNLLVLTAEASYIDRIMEEIGIGYLIRKISGQAGIKYILLQSREGIILSSRSLLPVLKIENDPFLTQLMAADTVGWRVHDFEGEQVLEIARPFESVAYPAGVYRIGLSLEQFREISRGYDRQIIIIAVILFLLTILVVAVVSINQNYYILDRTLRQMRSMTETIFDRLSSAVLACRADGTIIAVNKAFTQLTGLDVACIGKSIDAVAKELPFDLPRRIQPGERLVSFEQRITTPSGEVKATLLGVSSLPEEAGGGVVVLIHDITDQKRLEEESRRRERLSEMGDMAAGVAHEIRNPLNAIAIAAQRLKMEFEPKDDPDGYERLSKNILDEAARLNQILTRFLELAKARAAADRVIDLADAITKGVASVADEAHQRGVMIAYARHDPVSVRGAVEPLQQVFINLIKNSMQAMPHGGTVTIAVDTARTDAVTISVTDTGPGFSPEALNKIFQPYFTTKADGSGLGLALAYKTVIDAGGAIEAGNLPDGGARIQITLPRA
jgi:two-component system sensor histidine kinase HydH